MASVKIVSHTPFPFEKSPGISHDDSFASYLTLIKENFPLELTTSRPERLSCQISIGSRRKALDGELDVFSAEKYFNGDMDRHLDQITDTTTTITTLRTPSKKDSRTINSRAKAGSISSETSAGNSQSALLRDHRRRSPEAPKEANGKKFLGIFRCSCSNKRAIKIDNKESRPHTKIAQPQHTIERKPSNWAAGELQLRELRIERLNFGLKGDTFPFPPTLNQCTTPKSTTPKLIRDFKQDNNADLVPIDRKSFNLLRSSSASAACGAGDEDARSESSSELFEIESISTASHPFFRREPAPSTPAAGYEPSEASIEWSVATASAANFEDHHHYERQRSPPATPFPAARSQRPAFLLGCANDKAVNVISGAGGRVGSLRNNDFGPVTPAARYRAESCGVVYLSSGDGVGAVSGRALPPGARIHFS